MGSTGGVSVTLRRDGFKATFSALERDLEGPRCRPASEMTGLLSPSQSRHAMLSVLLPSSLSTPVLGSDLFAKSAAVSGFESRDERIVKGDWSDDRMIFLLGRNRTKIDAGTRLIEGFGESQFLSSMLLWRRSSSSQDCTVLSVWNLAEGGRRFLFEDGRRSHVEERCASGRSCRSNGGSVECSALQRLHRLAFFFVFLFCSSDLLFLLVPADGNPAAGKLI